MLVSVTMYIYKFERCVCMFIDLSENVFVCLYERYVVIYLLLICDFNKLPNNVFRNIHSLIVTIQFLLIQSGLILDTFLSILYLSKKMC